MRAKSIIEQEHRSLAAVLHGMLHVVREIRYRGAKPDFTLLRAMVDYIDSFSERLHHPKEDAYLFKFLALRCPAAAPLVTQLGEEHRAGVVKLRELRDALDAWTQDGNGFRDFTTRLAAYASFHWEHMRREESDVMPLAQLHLTAEDWKLTDEAFLGHTDPLFGVEPEAEFQELFRRIVATAPPPIGKGPPR